MERGIDPRTLALVSFGGAGGMHACRLAEELGISTVLAPRAGGVLSALGLAVSELRRDYVAPLLGELRSIGRDAARGGVRGARAAGARGPAGRALQPARRPALRRPVLRADGAAPTTPDELASAFAEPRAALRLHGPRRSPRDRQRPRGGHGGDRRAVAARARGRTAEPAERRRAHFDGAWHDTPVYRRDQLGAGCRSRARRSSSSPRPPASCAPAGPAASTTPARSSWSAGDRDRATSTPATARSGRCVRRAARGIAEEMGARAHPLVGLLEHQGAARLLLRAVRPDGRDDRPGRAHPRPPRGDAGVGRGGDRAQPRPGDVFLLNDPYAGGTHLPDVTIVSPVAVGGDRRLRGSRAHHSDVGGMQPGSMPSESRSIYQEGIIIPPVRLVRERRARRRTCSSWCWRTSAPRSCAAPTCGPSSRPTASAMQRLQEAVERYGGEGFDAAIREVLAYAERRTRAVIRELPDGTHTASSEVEGDGVDDVDIPIRASVDDRRGAPGRRLRGHRRPRWPATSTARSR